jgi:formamidopyrimidine-DNA glycosylase
MACVLVLSLGVPELPEVESVRRRLAPAMLRKRITSVDVRRPDLRKPFPPQLAKRLTGQTVVALSRRAKYLLASISSGETLLMHLGMSGWITPVHEARAGLDPHDHVVLFMSSGKAIVFNDPRRFGLIDLIEAGGLEAYPALGALGPEPLSREFDAAALARACRGRRIAIKSALMDQSVVAGLGNIYAAEALHVAGIAPTRRASTIATPSGEPREAAYRLSAAIKEVLTTAIDRLTKAVHRDDPFLVYERQGHPCPRNKCGGTIRRREQGGRSTYYCPVCQR